MKVFGKKTLALVLTIAMALSLCSFTAFAGEGTTYVLVDDNATLTAPSEAGSAEVTWSSNKEAVATVSSDGKVTGVAPGEATITATWTPAATAEVPSPAQEEETYPVTVVAKTVTAVELKNSTDATCNVPYKATFNANVLNTIKFTVKYGEHITKEVTASSWTPNGTLDTTVIGSTVEYTPTIADVPAGVTVPKVTVKVVQAQLASGASTNVGTITVLLGTREADLQLPTYAPLSLNNGTSRNFGIGSSTGGSSSSENGLFNVWTSADYNDDKVGTYTFKAAWKGNSDYYSLADLTLTVKVVDSDFTVTAGYEGKSLKSVLDDISTLLKGMYGRGLATIEFTDLDLDGGELYIKDKDELTEADETYYDVDEFDDIVYYPNGTGETSYIEYTAYTSNDREDISGIITLKSSEFVLLTAEIDDKGTVQFSASDFEDAIADWDDDWTLDYVKFSSIPNSTSKGYLYTEYDEDSSKNTLAKTSVKYYAEPEGKDLGLDDLTYVPGSKTSGMVDIQFTAYLVKNKKTDTIEGVYQINVIEKADLTIEAGVKESVSFDLDMFEEFYQENISKTYKNYDIVAVSFSGVPNSKEKGYLRNDGKSIKSPNDKKFYIDDDDEGDYAFEDLTFEGGSKASTTRAEFTVYAKKDGKGTAKTVTGTIDFIVGSTHSLSGSIKASETMKFAASLSAFEDLGGNDNVYVTFTGLPTGGKLVYNWGTGSQEDVTVGTEYYLSYKAGKKLLSNVTFVPSYSSSKQARTISIPVKAYNSKEKAVTGTINITVNYAAYSSRFTDITTSTYADSVDFLYNQGITTGMTATTFGPNSNVTRAQFVTFLYRAAGQPAVTGVTNKFTDVKSTGTYAYAYNAILWAVQNNITTGRSATKFDPAANVTHQELLTFLYRYDVNYLGHPGTQGSLSGFSEASSLQSYAVAPAKWAAYKGIIDGYTLQPAVAGSRATVALWLHRMLTL